VGDAAAGVAYWSGLFRVARSRAAAGSDTAQTKPTGRKRGPLRRGPVATLVLHLNGGDAPRGRDRPELRDHVPGVVGEAGLTGALRLEPGQPDAGSAGQPVERCDHTIIQANTPEYCAR